MNGFLSPEGVMHVCEYYEHDRLASELIDKYNLQVTNLDSTYLADKERRVKEWGFIYFGYTGDLGTNTDSYLFLDNSKVKITDEQYNWILKNINKITVKQYNDFMELWEVR